MLTDFFQVVLHLRGIDAVADAYSRHLGFRIADTATVSDAMARAWKAPAAAGKTTLLLQPASGAASWIRLVEGGADDVPLGRSGWNGVEILVKDVDALSRALEGSPFSMFSPVQALSFSDRVRFMQVRGPRGELLFLNQMDDPALGIPPATTFVDRPFVVTCGTRAVAPMLAWFRETLGMQSGAPMPVVMPALNRIFGFAPGTKHDLGMIRLDRPCVLEFDAYPPAAENPRRPADDLADGIALVSCSAASLAALPPPLAAAAEVIAAPPYDGARAVTIVGPEGLMLEVVERASGL